MADIVLGIGTSHTPMLSLPPEMWSAYAEGDRKNPELCAPPDGQAMSYEDLLERADPKIAEGISPEKFRVQYDACQKALNTLVKTLEEVKPDVLVIVSDDQDEILFEDNMPAFSVYWGDTYHLLPLDLPESAPAAMKSAAWGYGDSDWEVPVASGLGRHVIEHMIENDFDVAHSRYMNAQYGGSVARRYPSDTPTGELDYDRYTEPRPFGMPHGYAFIVQRLLNNKPMPILPILQNIYPPNMPTPKRCYAFGQALHDAIESWDSNARVVVVASGGLSHFVVDEEIDRIVIKGLQEKDADTLRNLPRNRLVSASAEIRNWVTASAAMPHLNFELLDYVPVYRTPAGTGGGWTFGRWQ